MWLGAVTDVDQSIAPAALSRSSSALCKRSQAPAACQSRSRRHAVVPEQPSSRGRCAHAIPVTKTKTMALKQTRSGTGRRPCFSGSLTGGIIASTTSHSSSRTSNTVATSHLHGRGYVTARELRRRDSQILCATSSKGPNSTPRAILRNQRFQDCSRALGRTGRSFSCSGERPDRALPVAERGHQSVARLRGEVLLADTADGFDGHPHLVDVRHASVAAVQVLLEQRRVGDVKRVLEVLGEELHDLVARDVLV